MAPRSREEDAKNLTHDPLEKKTNQSKTKDSPIRYNKTNLPSKDCVVCKRPFAWRKKWERCWDEVRYCSERCRRAKPGS